MQCIVTKTLNWFQSMQFSVASPRHIAIAFYFLYAFHWSCGYESWSWIKVKVPHSETEHTKKQWIVLSQCDSVLHRHAISQLHSTSRLHFIDHIDMNHGHVVINQCESAKFRNKTPQMFRLQHVVQVQAIYNINLKNKWASSWDYGTFCPL